MAYEAAPRLVSFDAGRALDRVRAVAGDGLLVVAELTSRDYNLLYVAEEVQQRFEAAGADIETVADDFHEYESLDFFEQNVFDDLLPTVGRVSAFVTFTDRAIIARLISGDEGLYVSVDRETDVTRLVNELEPIVRGSDAT